MTDSGSGPADDREADEAARMYEEWLHREEPVVVYEDRDVDFRRDEWRRK